VELPRFWQLIYFSMIFVPIASTLFAPCYFLVKGILYGRHRLILGCLGALLIATIIVLSVWDVSRPFPTVRNAMKMIPEAENYFYENRGDFQRRSESDDSEEWYVDYYCDREQYVFVQFEFDSSNDSDFLDDSWLMTRRSYYRYMLSDGWYLFIWSFRVY